MKKIIIFVLLLILLSIFLVNKDPTKFRVYADQSTHYIQAQSIAFDRDLKYTRKDYLRFYNHWEKKPYGMFLKYNGKDFYYGKPFFYSLYLSPFVALAKGRGVVFANIILALVLSFLVYYHFRQTNTAKESLYFLIPGLIFSQIIFFITVTHPDLFEATLLAVALSLWLRDFSEKDKQEKSTNDESSNNEELDKSKAKHFWGGKCFWASVVMGIAIYSKPPFIFFYLVFFIYLLLNNKKWALFSMMSLLLIWALVSSVHYVEDKTFSPYAGNRLYCLSNFPFENIPNELNLSSFNSANQFRSFYNPGQTLEFVIKRTRIFFRYLLENLFYYLFGRQTGMIIYQIGGLICLIMLIFYWRERRPGQVLLFVALILYILINFWAIPYNYFGGTTSFGNRYGLHILAGFFMLAPRLPKGKKIWIPTLFVFIIGGFFLLPFIPKSNLAIHQHIINLQRKPLSLMPIERTQLFILKEPPFALNRQKVITILLQSPVERNDNLGFFLPSNATYKTLLFFPENKDKTSYIAINGSNKPLTLDMRQSEQKNNLEVPSYSYRYIEIKKSNPDVYWNLTTQFHIIPLWWRSPTCWGKDGLYSGSKEMGLYVYQPKEFIVPHQQVEIYPQDPKFEPYLILGWENIIDKSPWNNGRWGGKYKVSAVSLYPKGEKNYRLIIRARSPFPEQKVDVQWNDKLLGSFSLKEKSSQFEFFIDNKGKKYDEFVILWLNHKITDLPKKYIQESQINENCSVFYEYIGLVPVGDLKITGWITGADSSNVLLTFVSEDGTVIGTTMPDSRGLYSFYGINSSWSGKVVPLKAGCKFEPEYRSYYNQTLNIDNQNFKVLKK